MKNPSPTVKTRLKGPLHKRFISEQEALCISESELLRLALLHFLERTPAVPGEVRPVPSEGVLRPKTVWMPVFLTRMVEERAAEKGMTFSRWISALVQSNLLEQAVLCERELAAVEASRRELSAIGRNINQIARALNEAYFQSDRVRLDRLAELSANLAKHQEAIVSLVKASRHSWRAE